MSYFTTKQGVRIFYKYDSRKGKPTLVFVHGLGCDSEYWANYARTLSAKYGILLVDLRGYGKSDKPTDKAAYKLENFHQDLIELLSTLKLKEYILIGHSLGGAIASDIAQEKLSGLKGVVLISAPLDFKDITKGFLFQLFLARFVPHGVYKLFQRKRHFSEETNKTFFCIKCLARNPLWISLNVLAEVKRREHVKKVPVPHRVIIFDKDEIVKNGIQKLYGDEVVLMHGSHIGLLTSYEDICKQIDQFIEKNIVRKEQLLHRSGLYR